MCNRNCCEHGPASLGNACMGCGKVNFGKLQLLSTKDGRPLSEVTSENKEILVFETRINMDVGTKLFKGLSDEVKGYMLNNKQFRLEKSSADEGWVIIPYSGGSRTPSHPLYVNDGLVEFDVRRKIVTGDVISIANKVAFLTVQLIKGN